MARMSDNPGSTETTDFGFRRVPRAAKRGMVRAVFDSVAPRYDLMNDLMSLGIHRAWKRVLVTALDPGPRRTLLDLAAGTGDIGLALAGAGRRAGAAERRQRVDAGGGARSRAVARRWSAVLSLLVADAERLPLPDRAVDRVSIAFGLRNCTDKAAVLAEARRVLRPGGRFFCLEFSHVQVAALQPLYDAWSFRVLPRLGRRGRAAMRRAIGIWRRASGRFPIRTRWRRCCARPGSRGLRCAICRAASRRFIRGGGCDGTCPRILPSPQPPPARGGRGWLR